MADIKKPGEEQEPSGAGAQESALQGGAEKDNASVLKSLLGSLGIDNLSAEHRAELESFLSGLDLKSGPDRNAEVIRTIAKKLETLGYKPQDIHENSLVKVTELDEAAADLNKLVTSAKEPTQNYPSNVGIYHFTVGEREGERLYERSGMNGVTAWAENLLRKPGDLGGNIFSRLFSTPLRSKINIDDIGANIKELGLGGHFTREGDRIAENIDDIRSGAMLDDLLRLRDEHPFLQELDTQEALAIAANMIADVHARSGRGIGELLANDIILQVEEGKITGARLALPDMKYGEKISAEEQKATDMLDLCFSAASAGLQTGGEDQARTNVRTVLENYDDAKIKEKLAGLVNVGRPYFTTHNKPRLGFDRVKDAEAAFNRVREIIRDEVIAGAVPLKAEK